MITLQLNTKPARRALSNEDKPRAQARKPARARQTRAAFAWVVFAIGLLCVTALAWVGQTAAEAQAGYSINTLRAEQRQLLADQQRIQYEISVASSAGRLDSDAAKLGLVQGGHWAYLAASGSPVALLHSNPDDTEPGSHSFFSQIALALGRPADAEAKGR